MKRAHNSQSEITLTLRAFALFLPSHFIPGCCCCSCSTFLPLLLPPPLLLPLWLNRHSANGLVVTAKSCYIKTYHSICFIRKRVSCIMGILFTFLVYTRGEGEIVLLIGGQGARTLSLSGHFHITINDTARPTVFNFLQSDNQLRKRRKCQCIFPRLRSTFLYRLLWIASSRYTWMNYMFSSQRFVAPWKFAPLRLTDGYLLRIPSNSRCKFVV